MYYVTLRNFANLLDALKKDYAVYVPVKKGDQRFYQRYSTFSNNILVGEVRAFEPLKAFFTRARERVAAGFDPEMPPKADKPAAVVGVKACDLKGFKIQDYVFKNHDFADPFYNRARKNNLVIAADCTTALDTCFCRALNGQPYPQEDFDLALSSSKGGFLVDVGSPKGQAVVDRNLSLFSVAKQEMVSEREEQRRWVTARVDENIRKDNIPHQDKCKGAVEKKYESDIWQDEAKSCVECGACNTVCPTCHCFLLYDQKRSAEMTRLRIWDSCMVKDFARVAGGANPRAKLWMRLRNRFEKKFDFFPKTAQIYACTGCGRCISACPAKIDIRKVLRRLTGNE